MLIVSDDLGYNDVSWHNMDMITPHMQTLVNTGVRLEQSYVQPLCTPTRAALMTGRYPIHTGRQHSCLNPQEPKGLNASFTLLPQYLQTLGYHTHMVGKWHLGFCHESYLPTRRGFDSYYGYWTGGQDYYQHAHISVTEPKVSGYDFREGEEVARSARGTYSTHLFADRAGKIIKDSSSNSAPFFLYLAFQSVHGPLQVPQEYEDMYKHIQVTAQVREGFNKKNNGFFH